MNAVTLPAESVSGCTEEEKRANIGLAPIVKAAVISKACAPAIVGQYLVAVLERLGEIVDFPVK